MQENIELKIMQFGQWIQMDLDRLLVDEIKNVKAIVNQAGSLLADSAIVNFGYKINMPYRVINNQFHKVPLNWWEHFKESYFSEWLKFKFPVKYREIKFEIRECYPLLPVPSNTRKFYYALEVKDECNN